MSKQSTPSDSKKDSSQVTLDFAIRFEDLKFSKSDLLGQGGYGKVYKGKWLLNTVAIKQYTAVDFSDKTKEEIRKEALIMATVSTQSDYLVRLKGVILEKPPYSLVMEYLPGGDLFHLLKSSQEITWPMRYRIGLDITIGLHHLHERSVLHRDLKSLNVLLDSNGRAKLADFGLSTLKTSSASTTAGGFKGTVLWSAPELFKRGAKATTASDIYSLAMVLWELVSHQIPFADAATPAIAADWVRSGEQENIPEGTPDEFKALILEGWHKDPAQRPKAGDLAKRLDALWETEQKKALTAAPTSPTTSTGSVSGSTPILSMEYGAQSGKPLPVMPDSGISTVTPAMALESEKVLAQTAKTPTDETVQKLKEMEKKMVQLELAHKKQVEEEQRKKQAEIDRLKQQHQIELEQQKKDSKLSPPPQTSTTAYYPQRLMPAPKAPLSPEQLKLQDELIMACEQGDAKATLALLKRGAKPDAANSVGKHSLGAAIWGMNPEVVNVLLKQLGEVSPMTWAECETHNKKHYNEIFIVEKLAPITFVDWNEVLQKIDPNPFIRAYHLQKVDEEWHDNNSASWGNLKRYVFREGAREERTGVSRECVRYARTETGFESYRTQIKQGIESASRPTERLKQQHQAELERRESKLSPPQTSTTLSTTSSPASTTTPTAYYPQRLIPAPKAPLSPEQLKLQDALILACEHGDAKEALNCIKQGAKPDVVNAAGKHPLGAAVWGMNPEVVNELLKQMKGIAPMTWKECEKHNLEQYKKVFIIPKFNPKTPDEWEQLSSSICQENLQNILIPYDISEVDVEIENPQVTRLVEQQKESYPMTSEEADRWDRIIEKAVNAAEQRRVAVVRRWIATKAPLVEKEYAHYRTQIKQEIQSASIRHESAAFTSR